MMGQLNRFFRGVHGGKAHWCPGCERMHVIPDSWTFKGSLEVPTFEPSVSITYNGPDAGEKRDDERDRAPQKCCHYNLTEGVLTFHNDSTHALKGQTVPLPELPEVHRDSQ